MCSCDSRNKLSPIELKMEVGLQQDDKNCSKLFELAATDDLDGFKHEVEEMGSDVNQVRFWYGRSFGSKKMDFEERTPIMIASLYGSTEVLKYIIGTNKVDVNRACGSDGATALHCVAAGGSWSSVEVVQILIDASADNNVVDVKGNKPGDLIASCVKSSNNSKSKTLAMLLNGITLEEEEEEEVEEKKEEEEEIQKKEYPFDVSLPDINNWIYGSDEFRMYSFKVKPCSRAYSHDWTECPFVHPGENARRRDPRNYHYTCVPCPDFKKGSCLKGDDCEYAHGVFESWLHPAQYRTRLCKDETSCSRKVCFFAHKHEDLRPLYASTGSAMPSPPKFIPVELTSPPMSSSSVMWRNMGSRLKTGFSAGGVDVDTGLLGLEKIRTHQRQQLVEEMVSLSSPYSSSRKGDLSPANLDQIFGSLDPSLLSQLQGLSPKYNNITGPHLQSPNGPHVRQNTYQLGASYTTNISSPPSRIPAGGGSYGFQSSAAVAAAVMNSRLSAFTKRSQSFIDRSTGGSHRSPIHGQSKLSEWGPPEGQVNWGFNSEEMNKFRKSPSFGYRNGTTNNNGFPSSAVMPPSRASEPDVNTAVKDEQQRQQGVDDGTGNWIDQMYIEQEQVVGA